MRLLWITNIPSPYRVDFFNVLGKSCQLTVLFEKPGAADRDSSWKNIACTNFEAIFMSGQSYKADSAFSFDVLGHLRRGLYDEVVVTNFSSPTGALAIAYLKATGQRYYLESDGGFPSSSALKKLLKRLVIGGAHGYFSTSDTHDAYYLAYGARREKLIRYPFTSVRAADVLREPPTPEQKRDAKEQLGIAEPRMILAVGQFIHRKGFDILLRASASLTSDTAVCIVGGEPTDEYRDLVNSLGLAGVYFPGFKPPSELRVYFTAADVFVLPTREDIWGLVINEALAHALPVITTDRCIAGLELVAKNGCGHIVPAENIDALQTAISCILTDPDSWAEMQTCALQASQGFTIERMAALHLHWLSTGAPCHAS